MTLNFDPFLALDSACQTAGMAWVERPDGVRLAVQERGEGPAILCVHSFVQHPGVYGALYEELARDHRVITYHPRGTGDSTHRGPYDMDTDAADMTAVIEEAAPVEAVLANGESSHWALRVAVAHPDLLPHVVALETVPFRTADAEGSEALIGSASVLNALVAMIRADYRTGLHAAIQRGNPSLSDEEMRERVDLTAAHCPPEAGVARLENWIADDPTELARALGDRLTLVFEGASGWFPASLHELAREYLTEARFERLERGAISAPELTGAVIREVVSYAN